MSFARGSSCWLRRALDAVDCPDGWHDADERSATGVAVSHGRAWPVWSTSRALGPRPNTAPRRLAASCVLERPPPAGFARWNGPLIAAELGDVHEQHVWRVLRAQKIDLDGRKSWCESDDPEFAAKAADVVGLYMAPPEKRSSSASTRSPRSRRWSARRAI